MTTTLLALTPNLVDKLLVAAAILALPIACLLGDRFNPRP